MKYGRFVFVVKDVAISLTEMENLVYSVSITVNVTKVNVIR